MSFKKIIVFSLLLATLQACNDSDKSEGGIFCTQEFVTIPVHVQDVAGTPIALDSIKVLKGTEDITLIKDFTSADFAEMKKTGSYPLINDAMIEKLLDKKVDVLFKAYIGKDVVAEKTIQVSSDECHVFNVTEDLKVVIKEPRK